MYAVPPNVEVGLMVSPAPVMRYKLTEFEWAAIKPFLPNKPLGVPRANDRRVLNGIFWIL